MKIKIVNNGTSDVAAPGSVTVAAGGTLTLTGRTVDEYQGLLERYVSDDVQVCCTLENSDLPPLQCVLKSPADPAADATTCAACGFDIKDLYGTAFSTTDQMYFGVFDDEDCETPSETATLATAATGTIVSGSGTNTLLVTPDAGVLSVTCTIAEAAAQTVYFKAWAATDTTRPMDTHDTDEVSFTVS